jgi:Cu(I)/Ag(I) efflux system membrane fusion protein
MAARPRWVGWLAVPLALLALGALLWYAHARQWLAPAYAWVHHLVARGDAGQSGQGGMNMPGMNMPGMDMGSRDMSSDESSPVPGHAAVTLPAEVQQRIGVTVGRVERAPLRMSVRTVGIVQPAEPQEARVHVKTEGWVQKLFVNYTGQVVQKGDPLLAIYSPQFLTTQQEYLNALQADRNRTSLSDPQSLASLARRRLELWDVPAAAIQELERTGQPRTNLTLVSPLTGTVLQRDVLEGDYLTPGKQLYLIADLSTVWVQAKVYEYELPHVELGQPAEVTVADLPGRVLAGKVVFVQPTVEQKTRTVQVRVELPNKHGKLKPGMFAHVVIRHTMGEGLLVPASAVIRTGKHDIVYRAEKEGRFVPVEVEISPFNFGDRFEILGGLKAGDRVATSANFLIDSESRLRAGGGGMAGMDMGNMDMGGMKGMGQAKGGMKGMDHKKGMKGMEGMEGQKMKH